MLDRDHIIPMPIVESHEPVDSLIAGLDALAGDSLCQALDTLLSTSRQFTPEQVAGIDRAASTLHRSHRDTWFYQRVFELALKIHGFDNDWRSRLRASRIHEKHRLRIHSNAQEPRCATPMVEVSKMCKEFMAGREVVYDRVSVLAHCILELSRANGEAVYNGPDDIFYLVEYVYRRDLRTLLRWARNVRVMNDWSLLYLRNYPDFLYTELKYLSSPLVVREVIVQQKSHRLYDFLFIKLSIMFPRDEMMSILAESYDGSATEYTARVFLKLFGESQEAGEKALKWFIRRTRAQELGEMFYERCVRVDGDYVEVLGICMDKVHLIDAGCLEQLVRSHYWPYLTHRYEDFSALTRLLLERGLSPRREYDFLAGDIPATPENLRKVLFVAQEMPLRRREVVDVLGMVSRKMLKRRARCTACQERGPSLGLCSAVSFEEKVPEADEREVLMVVYEILETVRGLDVPTRTLRILSVLDPELFCRRAVDDTRYDCFFIRRMNIVLKDVEGRFRWAIPRIAEMSLFWSSGYWEVCVRKSLRLRSLWKAVVSFSGGAREKVLSECSARKRNGLYSLRNVVIHSDSSVIADNECSSETAVPKAWGFLSDKQNLRHALVFDDRARLKYLIRELEGRRDLEVIGTLVRQLGASTRVGDGMVFRDSWVAFETPFRTFTLQVSFGQCEEAGEQVVVSLEGKGQAVKIGRTNGKLFMRRVCGGDGECVLLGEDSKPKMSEELWVSYKSPRLSFSLNGRTYSSRIEGVDRVRIGAGFRGVVEKVLLCESELPRRHVLGSKRQSLLYVDELSRVEKLLTYKNCAGVFMDSTVPYFLNGRVDVEIRNVIDNRNVYWMCNGKVRELLSREDMRRIGC